MQLLLAVVSLQKQMHTPPDTWPAAVVPGNPLFLPSPGKNSTPTCSRAARPTAQHHRPASEVQPRPSPVVVCSAGTSLVFPSHGVACGQAVDDTLPMGPGEQDSLANPWHAKGWGTHPTKVHGTSAWARALGGQSFGGRVEIFFPRGGPSRFLCDLPSMRKECNLERSSLAWDGNLHRRPWARYPDPFMH